ncbi:voltage-gated potassium channel protein [Acidithiobacillus sp.]
MYHLPPLLRPNFRQRLRRFWGKAQVVLRLEQWFPHMPLALAVGALGTLNILDGLPRLSRFFPELGILAPVTALSHSPVLGVLGAVPELVAGVVLLFMSIGLLFRSRFSWAITLLLAAATLAILLHHYGLVWSGIAVFNGVILLGLLLFHRSFSRSSVAAGTLFAAISILLLLGYAVFGSYVLGKGFTPPITNLVTALYFSVVTMSTVGYGDITPHSQDARLFVVSIIILGITVFATSISTVIVPLVNGRMNRLLMGEKKPMKQKHYLIVGDNALAHNTYRELKARHLPALVLLPSQPKSMWMDPEDFRMGDATEIEVLRKAGGERALAILALRLDDSENAFIVLAAKELGGRARTVAAVKDSKNMERMRRVEPDLIIAPEVLGGELLVMTLSGEALDGEAMMSRMFSAKA